MKKHATYLLFLISNSLFAFESSFSIKLFERTIKLPSTCVLQVVETAESQKVAIYRCDKGEQFETSVLLEEFNYNDLMEIQNAIGVTINEESKLGDIIHFHIEVEIDTPTGASDNFIDAFCNKNYCIIALGTSNKIANNIKHQLGLKLNVK